MKNQNVSRRLMLLCILSFSFFSASSLAKKFDDLALTPPMGWNSWNTFACEINENMIKEMADIMVSSGMKDAGYQYINIDDCWHGERDTNGNIQVNPKHFPSGMKALADYVHSKGLKLGLYSDAGWKTCGGKPGSRGYEFQDAKQYAAWGIDYLKYDWCNTEGLNAEGAYLTMRDALYTAGHPVVFSICEWGDNQPWEWAKDIGHLWRTSGDIINCWNCEHKHLEGTENEWSSWGVLKILDMRHNIRQYAGPGHWNDMDMMEVGNGMSKLEDQSHFTMWAMLASPLIAGNDLRSMSKQTLAILTNEDVIAINQDILGIQGFKYQTANGVDVWLKPMANGRWAMAVLNRNDDTVEFNFDFVAQGVIKDVLSDKKIDLKNTRYQIKDVWHNKMLGDTTQPLRKKIQGHETLTLILSM
ncbi:glycoside hydrolase family 27 protein [Neptunicella sp.]|uniref:glycoside hydrolase family 27 protein n=1 Tax=Neptunicella sp. TaxID=2125986 RepID=UPI003F692A3B